MAEVDAVNRVDDGRRQGSGCHMASLKSAQESASGPFSAV
jgi:hypothetical protein